MFSEQAIANYWGRVDMTNRTLCWNWTGFIDKRKGYGLAWVDGRRIRTHRVAMMLHLNGPIPDGLHVCHRCDNPACCNPAHLFLGTNDDNIKDRVVKGRSARNYGEKSKTNKLTSDAVKELLWARVGGAGFRELAARYGLDKKTVGMICRGENWPHIPGTEGAPTLAQLLAVPMDTRPSAVLDEDTVSTVMRRLARGESGKAIARDVGLHFATISDIKHGKTWSHLAGVNGNPTVEEMQAAPPDKFAAKLDAEMARTIKARLASDETVTQIAKSLGVSTGTISHIKHGRTWAHV